MPGLTAKVFRTYNASHTFQIELKNTPAEAGVHEKVLAYNRANRQVAILCNHQKSVSKNHGQSMENMRRKIQHIKYQRYLVKRDLVDVVGKTELKKELLEALDPESDLDDETIKSLQEELDNKELERKNKKLAEKGEEPLKTLDSPVKSRSSNKESLLKKYHTLSARLMASKTQLIDKDENKTTALGTSKTNYIDPRISVAWCSLHNVPIEKMFNQTLRKKFQWAMDVNKSWKF
jgi:DNA topoisomerase-1